MDTTEKPLNLVAGPLTLVFEPPSGMLRHIRLGDVEVLRGIYVAVRDRNWDTVAPRVSKLSVDQRQESFSIDFDADCVRDEVHFHWHGSIRGSSSGTLVYQMRGEALSTFLRNRIGFCILHPIRECAGRPCVIEHVDGMVTEGCFPREIAPHQPFKHMRSIRHSVSDRVDAEVMLAGDVFEMEDQRNWTDASYKTYCTPLERPFPVEVHEGDRVQQAVTLALLERTPGAAEASGMPAAHRRQPPSVEFHGRRLPPVGLCIASHGREPASREIERLARLNLSHLRVDVTPADHASLAGFELAARQTRALDVPLDLAVTLSDAAEEDLMRLGTTIERLRPRISHCFVFHQDEKSTSARWVELARSRLEKVVGDAVFGGGTNAYFAELNRGRPDVAAMEAVVYSMNPQVHASDDASLIETLEAQGDTVRSAHAFCGGKPICVGPITLRPRFNPNATAAAAPPAPGELPPEVDPRQSRLIAAAWTLGSMIELAEAGAARLTYFETTGWRGIMETDAGSPLPDKFPSVPGGVYPVYHVLADIGEFASAEVAPLEFGPPFRSAMLRMATPRGAWHYRLLLANLSPDMQRVELPRPEQRGGTSLYGRIMDETNVQAAIRDPEAFRNAPATEIEADFHLRPYAYACIDLSGDQSP